MTKTNDFNKIYLLTNKVNGKIYIGQTWLDYKDRMQKNGIGYKNSKYLYSAIKMYKVENFEYTTLAECTEQSEADMLEIYFIDQYNSCNSKIGYNLKEGGSHGKHSDETKIQISETTKRIASERPADFYDHHKGNKYNLGRKQTEEQKQGTAEFMKQWHAKHIHPMKDKHHTDEAKQAMSDKLTGIEVSEITRAKRRQFVNNRRALKETPEYQTNLIADYLAGMSINDLRIKYTINSNKVIYRILRTNEIPLSHNQNNKIGKKRSPETKAKMSEIRIKIWADKKKKQNQ